MSKVMSRPSVVEHFDHYLQPQSLDLTAKKCRCEMEMLNQEKKELGRLFMGIIYTESIKSLERHWKMLFIAVKRYPSNGYLKERECKENIFLLNIMLKSLN